MKKIMLLPAICLLCACQQDNQGATYGDSGLPSNCRAYVQYAIDAYRKQEYSADDTMIGLERNCGSNGSLWEK